MKQTVDIINDIVTLLTTEVNILDVTANVDGTYTLLSGCTWWITELDKVTITGKIYTVNEFVLNTSLKVTPDDGVSVPTVTTFTLTTPSYINGTLKMSQNEVTAVYNKPELMPFVYLYEPITDRKNTDAESIIDRESDLRIFFLSSANFEDWLTDDHYTNIINPMQQMVDLFIEKIKESKFFTDEMTYDNIPLLNFSVKGEQGQSIFDCNLSGIELRLDAQIREDLSCELYKCNC